MGWRSVMISQPTKLSVQNRQLKITQDEEFSIPMEDVSTIILETPQVNMSARFISDLANNKIVMYSCDEKHLPNGIFMPFASHSRELKIIKSQLEMTEALKKRCWQQIIIQKIKNQARVVQLYDNVDGAKFLETIAKSVNSGDTENREAVAAKYYFKELFGNTFNRNLDNNLNIALNYGYAIIRGAIARTLVSYGYITSVGIHHKSELNNYNLADDFIEPYRALVDLWVRMCVDEEVEFNKKTRAELVNLLNMNMLIENKKYSVLNAIDIMIASFTTAIQNQDSSKLKLPVLMELEIHSYE